MMYDVARLIRLIPLLLALALLAGAPATVSGQSPGEPFGRNPSQDFNNLCLNCHPQGIWSDGTTMWVADWVDDKIYAYSMTTKARDPGRDFDTLAAAGNTAPYGIWSDGTTMWVADDFGDKIYAYSMATKVRDAGKDFNTLGAAGNDLPQGVWSDGTTMWVADWGDDKIYAYSMTTKARDAGKDFDTLAGAGSEHPYGIWSDGTTMWVLNDTFDDTKIYAYSMATKARDAGKDFDTLADAGNTAPSGIWSDGTTMWVSDWGDDKIYAYNLATKARDAAKDFNTLDPDGHEHPYGIWSDGTTMWVADTLDAKIYAYDLSTKARDADKDFNTLAGVGVSGQGSIWSDGTTMWGTNVGDAKIYAYNLITKARDAAKDFNTLAAGNITPIGIWSDGTTMWVVDDNDDKIYAYSLATKARDAAKDFNTLDDAGIDYPSGIWSDGTTMWVAAVNRNKIYAYDLSTKARDAAKDFNTLAAAGNDAPFGIWSDGTTMWVADFLDDKIYAYCMPGGCTSGTSRSTIRPAEQSEEPEPPPPSSVKAHCIADTDEDSDGGRIELGGFIRDRWIGGCPSVTGGGRLAKYYTFSIPHTTSVSIALGSHFDDFLVLRRGDLGGALVARDDDSGPGNDSHIETILPAGDYTIEATTYWVQGIEGDFTLSTYTNDRILYSGYPSFAAGEESTDSSQGASYLDIRILPTLPLPTMQIWLSDRDGFGPGEPGAAEKLLQGRIESDAGSPGSIMLAVPNGVWVDHAGITVQTATSVGGEWEKHTQADEQKLLDDEGGFFGILKSIASAAASLIGGNNPLETLVGWIRDLSGGQMTVPGESAAMLGLGESALSPIFQASYANCYSQVSVPWLVEEETVKEIVVSIPVILTDDEYVSVGAEFIAKDDGDNEHSLVQLHDLLDTGQSLPTCQRP